jgi:hypothetical protein
MVDMSYAWRSRQDSAHRPILDAKSGHLRKFARIICDHDGIQRSPCAAIMVPRGPIGVPDASKPFLIFSLFPVADHVGKSLLFPLATGTLLQY